MRAIFEFTNLETFRRVFEKMLGASGLDLPPASYARQGVAGPGHGSPRNGPLSPELLAEIEDPDFSKL